MFYFNQTDQLVNHTIKKSDDDNNKRKRERNAKKKRKCSESPETFGMCSTEAAVHEKKETSRRKTCC